MRIDKERLPDRYDDALDSVRLSYEKLAELNPEHPLLSFLKDYRNGSFVETKEFRRTYGSPFLFWLRNDIRRLERFQGDLEKAINEEGAKVSVAIKVA